ncbi:MAG TPA: GFA family protein [Pseudomonadales bacterium]|nr:GFA family protein [Pseudomonadales bacterium]
MSEREQGGEGVTGRAQGGSFPNEGQEDVRLEGGCHCGAVRFSVGTPLPARVLECDCAICSMTAYLHLIVPRAAFELHSGADVLHAYRFGTGVARHDFCTVCGIKSFYVPRSHPQGISVNLRCLDRPPARVEFAAFDRRDWPGNDDDRGD